MNNSLYLTRKYTRPDLSADINYLFREVNHFKSSQLEEKYELRGTDYVQGQIFEHIFTLKRG